MHLGCVQRHRQDPVDAGRDQQVRDQPTADRDPGRVLLVRPRVRVVRHHRGDLLRRRTARGVDHQQQLHQVLLRRRYERLHDVHVSLPTVLLQLHLQAVVAETMDLHRASGTPRSAQIRSAKPVWALPLNTTISRTALPEHAATRHSHPISPDHDLAPAPVDSRMLNSQAAPTAMCQGICQAACDQATCQAASRRASVSAAVRQSVARTRPGE